MEGLAEFRAVIWRMAPAVLDAVAAFAYGMQRITEAFEAYDQRQAGGRRRGDP